MHGELREGRRARDVMSRYARVRGVREGTGQWGQRFMWCTGQDGKMSVGVAEYMV
jgi:hypothetical protein